MRQEPHLLERARRLRRELTPFEAKLWRHLSRSQLGGYKFRRQQVIGSCIADFFCPQKALIVEVDGDTHEPARDAVREAVNEARGFVTVRYSNAAIGKNINGVLEHLLLTLGSLPDRWPHPDPSPKGDGK